MPNRVRFDGRAHRFYEVWYFIFNDARSGDGFWIRYTLLNPLDDHPGAGGALWFAFTDRIDRSRSVALRHGFGRDALRIDPGAHRVGIGDALLEEGRFAGGFASGGHDVSWALEYDPATTPHYYFGERLRRLTERRNSVTVPNPRIEIRGTVTIDGRRLETHGIGHQAHHWGTAQASRWLWGHCCDFEKDDRAVVELLSARGPGGMTATFVNLYCGDRVFLCDGVAGLALNRASAALGAWRFEGVTPEHRVIADVRVDPADVHGFAYTATDYRRSECWNTQVGDCLVRVTSRRTGEIERVLRSRGRAAAEIHDADVRRIPYRLWPDADLPRIAVD